jgi:hypothetical protein
MLDRTVFESRDYLASLRTQSQRSWKDLARETVPIEGIAVLLVRHGLQGHGDQSEHHRHERGSRQPDPSAGTHRFNLAQPAPPGQLAVRSRHRIGLATLAGEAVARRLPTESAGGSTKPHFPSEKVKDPKHLTTPFHRDAGEFVHHRGVIRRRGGARHRRALLGGGRLRLQVLVEGPDVPCQGVDLLR